jgi:hypothetical protein
MILGRLRLTLLAPYDSRRDFAFSTRVGVSIQNSALPSFTEAAEAGAGNRPLTPIEQPALQKSSHRTA